MRLLVLQARCQCTRQAGLTELKVLAVGVGTVTVHSTSVPLLERDPVLPTVLCGQCED